jgi:peptidoglycan/LPS O-acetylase OafA/YrhL
MHNASRERVPELDGLRAIACLLVLWVHLGPASFQPPPVLSAGSTGVDLFFVLSGFLITRILLFNRQHGIPLKTFMLKRAARIFPVAYIGLVLCLLVRPSSEMIYSAAYVQNLAAIFDLSRGVMCTHYWTLAIEEQFYLVVPFIVLFWPTKSLRLCLVAICICCIASIYAIISLSPTMDRVTLDLAISCGTTTRGWLLLAGSLIACFESHLRFSTYKPLVVSTSMVAISAALISPSFSVLGLQDPVAWFGGASGFGDGMLRRQLIVLALFIFCLSPTGRRVLTILRDPLLAYIGARSYGLYVYHMAVFEVMGVRKGLISTESGWMACLAIALTFLIAELSYRFIELPTTLTFSRPSKSKAVDGTLSLVNSDATTANRAA